MKIPDQSINQKVLYCVAPYSSLFVRRPWTEIQFGSGVVRSFLEKSGLSVECIDFEATLNKMRNANSYLTDDDCLILSNPYFSVLFAEKDGGDFRYITRIDDIIERLVSQLPGRDYSCVVFSLPRDEKNIMHFSRIINFSLLLARRIKTMTGAKVIFGGQALSNSMNMKDVNEAFRHVSCDFVDYVFLKNADDSLLDVIKSKKRLSRPKILTDHFRLRWDAFIDYLSRFGLFQSVTRQYRSLKKTRKHPFHKKYLNRLRIEPSFQGFDMTAYQVDVPRAFEFPDWSQNHFVNSKQQNITIYPLKFMQGCTHQCAFCSDGASGLTMLPVKEAVDQIERVMEKYPQINCFRFLNSQINASNRYAVSFANEVLRRKLKIFFSDSACLRNPQEEVFSALREAGCIKLWVGMESLSSKVLKVINKNLPLEDIHKNIEFLHKNEIWIGANIISSFPFEDQQDHACNCDFIKENLHIINIWSLNVFELYRNTHFYSYADRYGIRVEKDYFPGGQQYRFAEKGVQDFSKRQSVAAQRIVEFNSLIPEYNCVANSDHIVFYCYANGLNKRQITDFIKRYYDEVKNKDKLLDKFFINVSCQKGPAEKTKSFSMEKN